MIKYLANKIFGTRNERELKKFIPTIEAINDLEAKMKSHTDEELKAYTDIFRERISNGESLDDLLIEAFAVVREVGKRVLNMRHFDVQLMGGIVLHQGKISEMKTGEGKTLVATLAAYLNALEGKGVHIVTVNDYLAQRDAKWMGGIYKFLGLTVGTIQHDMDEVLRKQAYGCDITYGTNNEFGFDFLRDNMKFEVDSLVQREFNFAIVDEVDSILIDEARTPLIISGPTEESTSFYYTVNDFVKRAKNDPTNYELDEKSRTVVLTEKGIEEAERFFKIENLYDLSNMDTLHQIFQALKAHLLFRSDVDYLLKEGQVLIVDEFTGRVMPGRRYSDGLHQALEAKENVKIEKEYQTLASITFQNYFRMYKKMAGMTGTAMTEAAEFAAIYDLDSIEIPTNQTLIRTGYPDVIYGSKEEKWDAVVNEIRELNQKGQPVLVGTISIENSELLSRKLRRQKIPHVVLNAKYHESEAEIVANSWRRKPRIRSKKNMKQLSNWEEYIFWEPRDMRPDESTINCEGDPVGREIRVHRDSIFPWKTT
jgi:preprotein translocase subunit SecA